jgi:hypothetical protein
MILEFAVAKLQYLFNRNPGFLSVISIDMIEKSKDTEQPQLFRIFAFLFFFILRE